jgi:hypothetical protein
VPRLAQQAAHLLDVLGIPEADVLGVSFGGAVAQQLALDNPQRVRRLVLASTSVGLGGVPGHPLALALLATPLRYYSPAFFRRTARVLYGPLDADGDGDLLQAQVNARRARPPTMWGYVSQLTAAAGWTSLPWLHRIRARVLVLSGDADPIVPPVNARILAARLPHAELEIVRGAGHLLLSSARRRSRRASRNFSLRSRSPRVPAEVDVAAHVAGLHGVGLLRRRVRGTFARLGSVGLAGIEPSTSPLSGLAAVAAFALVSVSALLQRILWSRVGPAATLIAAGPGRPRTP